MANPLLALQVQTPQIDIASAIGRGQELQTARLGNLLQQYQLEQAQRQDEHNNALAALYKAHGAGIATGNPEDINALAAVDPKAAMDFGNNALGQAKTKSDIAQSDFKLQSDRAGRVASLFGSVLDAPDAAKPLVFQWVRNQAKSEGYDVSKMPEAYSPDLLPILQSGQKAALSAKEQLDQQEKLRTDSPDYKGQVAAAEAGAKFPYESKLAQIKADAAASATGDFGRGMTGKAYSILQQGIKDPAIRGTPEYLTAYQILSNPRVDPNTGTIVRPDMSAFPPPTAKAGPGGIMPGTPGERTPTIDAFAPPNPSQADSASAGYATRLSDAANVIDQNEGALTSLKEVGASKVPMIGNYLVSPEYQKADQAARNFINAQLRRESGAAIADSEFDNARKQYLPQPGDSKEVLAQKKASRQTAVRNMQLSAGNVLLPPGVVQHASPPKNATVVPQDQGFGTAAPKVVDFNDLPDK